MKKFLKNTRFHKTVYFTLLFFWTIELWHGLNCFSCNSSLGIPYGLLYFPIAIMLVVQVLYDTRIIWFTFFLFSVLFSLILIFDEYGWMRENQNKVEWANFWIISTTIIETVVFALFLILIYAIKPAKQKQIKEVANTSSKTNE